MSETKSSTPLDERKTLAVWRTEGDLWVARSALHVADLGIGWHGVGWPDDEPIRLDDDEPLTLLWDDHSLEQRPPPDGATVVDLAATFPGCGWTHRITMASALWAQWQPAGLLSSTEW